MSLPRSLLYPVLSEQGRAFLAGLSEHPHAPRFRNASGHRLQVPEIETVRAFHQVETSLPACGERTPDWLEPFLLRLRAQVPFFRHFPSGAFRGLPTTSRADLARDIAAFVPDDLPTSEIIHFESTGTTGHRVMIASHPMVAANHLAFLKKALALHGILLTASRGQTAVVLAGFQESSFTYTSVNPLYDEAGIVKLNLHPNDWKDPADRAKYLDWLAPELVTGDPLSLPELARIGMTHRPKAALSTSMALSPALRQELSERLGCPVVDVYSMNESGPIAAKGPGGEDFHLLQSRLLVELLDPTGKEVAPGERGEITLTGGYNPYLPLFRYRTGDWARRHPTDPRRLVDLEGRSPVRFRDGQGRWLNNIEVSQCLAGFALPQFRLHQDARGAFHLQLHPGSRDHDGIRHALEKLLASPVAIALLEPKDKVVAYTSNLAVSP